MILRSGLIQNRPGVDADRFAEHWRTVHGPLASRVPGLRGYAQNLVTARTEGTLGGLHQIDGISQLWFENNASMDAGTNSPEQQACIEDIAGFLAGVTLAIQKPGQWNTAGRIGVGCKMMAVYAGGCNTDELSTDIGLVLDEVESGIAYRLNPVIRRGVVVDRSVASSQTPLTAILEAWLPTEDARSQAMKRIGQRERFSPAAVMAVSETVLLPPVGETGALQ